ncbi:MAG: hypothetical protein A3I44_02100 [Candidatus Sungbacteria bacterium RIFCSPLOWO2_02_FULL_51_17]|uniref:Nicotinamide mononucleotide transporter n=1 Tax=Candidatus Sungbacteria bacterium RIFCSPHIGHO2_02_FULL_51_29 TaxID=1802273 RepID=A0A1G2KXK3_9BACT|nr:MAG: hypothetical protein A2676_04255 [Candidatus Sungbacteria bacterium RIFCSPHIGHO2_01_FULL_51_22]OHA03159.1 MAG: hypothetical protein A3C16_01720 [Candidatus Sungbacteria bacterium RIFCSPHIGHO2_02_FULL_51_29]OHA04806.1 MAG: hypothetical protein A3B29_03280 [Candidatus Sungbacteria bacterium RIFCSPLOWO2_01_FULL_51_34]OHA11094.1 MAG: hypothetical protein A3I44_02100 [Candidatus Sungbacteria bacterium RIFCSPLOWO2_02_FULL_51_17]
MLGFFDINNTFFMVFEYQMSYIEFFGTILTIWSVWLTAKARILSWPIGIIGVVLYMFLFYQIQLYSDLFEQVYFLITGFWGWWVWTHPKIGEEVALGKEIRIAKNSLRENIVYACIIAVGTGTLTYVAVHLDAWFPSYFPEPAAFPFLDAFTTAMSFTAQWLLARRRLENWMLWIVVDVIAIWLYWSKGIKFVSLEYALFFVIASIGLIKWVKEYRGYSTNAIHAHAEGNHARTSTERQKTV